MECKGPELRISSDFCMSTVTSMDLSTQRQPNIERDIQKVRQFKVHEIYFIIGEGSSLFYGREFTSMEVINQFWVCVSIPASGMSSEKMKDIKLGI